MLVSHLPEGLFVEVTADERAEPIRVGHGVTGQASDQPTLGNELAGAQGGVAGLDVLIVVGPEERERCGEGTGGDPRDHVEHGAGPKLGPAGEEPAPVRAVLAPP